MKPIYRVCAIGRFNPRPYTLGEFETKEKCLEFLASQTSEYPEECGVSLYAVNPEGGMLFLY